MSKNETKFVVCDLSLVIRKNYKFPITNYKFSMPLDSSHRSPRHRGRSFFTLAARRIRSRGPPPAIGAQGRFHGGALRGASTSKGSLFPCLATNYGRIRLEPHLLILRRRASRSLPPTPKVNYRMVNESLLTKIAIFPAEKCLSRARRESRCRRPLPQNMRPSFRPFL